MAMTQKGSGQRYDYQEVDQLVKAYQQGDEEAALKLIEAFSGFLTNFLLLVRRGVVDFHNKSLRTFLSLFIRDYRIRRTLLTVYRDGDSIRQLLYTTAAMICNQCSIYDEEDIWAEFVAEFLAMARKYRNDKGCFFHVYVTKAFPYRAYRRIANWIGDPTAVVIRQADGVEVSELEDQDSQQYEEQILTNPLLLIEEDTDLDENWINGDTCSEQFAKLTPLERRVLAMYYHDGLRDKEIAEKLGFATGKIRYIRNQAKKKLSNF